MHADVLGNVLKHHRFYVLDTVVEKLALPLDNALNHAVNRLPSMLNISQQIDGGADFILDKILCLFRCIALIEQMVISRTDPQPRAAVVDKIDDVLALDLFDINFGRNVNRVFG